MRLRAAALLLAVVVSTGAARKPDPLVVARQFYNLGQYDQALEAAQQAASNPSTVSSARLVLGRARLERYRQTRTEGDLEHARADLRAVDPRALDAHERLELQVGFAVLVFFEDQYGAAAELLDPIVDASSVLSPDAHDRAFDWWATALDRQAQALPIGERGPVYTRMSERIEQELRHDPMSAPAAYWLAAASRATGDLDRAWAAASAAWIRSTLSRDRGAALRVDLDTLVTEAIIPEKAARVAARERRQTVASLTAEWESFKKIW